MIERTPLVKFSLLKRKETWCVTLRGWLLLTIVAVLIAFTVITQIVPFLAVSRKVDTDLLVVEGWVPEYSLKELISEFEKGNYELLVTTGGPFKKGEAFAEFKTHAEFTAAVLREMGFSTNKLVAVPCSEMLRNRTYASAVAFSEWIADSGRSVDSLNVYTRGTHARRTWHLFQLALPAETEVGIIAGTDLRYDAERWWVSSEGVQDVLIQTIGYIYARCFFHPN